MGYKEALRFLGREESIPEKPPITVVDVEDEKVIDKIKEPEEETPDEPALSPEPSDAGKELDGLNPKVLELEEKQQHGGKGMKEDPEPRSKPKLKIETIQTTSSRNTRVEANKVIKPEGNVGEVELGKAGIAGAALAFLDLFSGMSGKVALALMIVALLGIAFGIYHVRKSLAPKEEAKTSSGDPVRDYIAKYNK